MKVMDEFGSVLALTTVVLGLCAAVHEVFSGNESESARAVPSYRGYGVDESIQFAAKESVGPAFSVEWAAAVLAVSADSGNSARFAAGPPLPVER